MTKIQKASGTDDTKEHMLGYINQRISANNEHASKYGNDEFYDGANTALQEFAVAFELVENYAHFKNWKRL